MAFNDEIVKTNINPVILLELDIGKEQTFFTNYRAGTWYVNFDVDYPDIDSSLLDGVSVQDITRVGSVTVDGSLLTEVVSAAVCQTTNESFYYDDSEKELFIHLDGGADPLNYNVVIGVVTGYRQGGTTNSYNGYPYPDRLASIGSISINKDPDFFGSVNFSGGSVELINVDGEFDTFPRDNDMYGNEARLFLGFEGLAYSEFTRYYTGIMENPVVTEDSFSISLQDRRKELFQSVPPNQFDTDIYSDLNEDNEGARIPLGFGIVKNIPVICTNEDEAAPANYDFKIFDTADFTDGMKEITTVYVEGTSKATASEDLTNCTFQLASADYSPGDTVTCDCIGFVDSSGDEIQNSHDIVKELLDKYLDKAFTNDFFDIANWKSIRGKNIGIFINTSTQLIEIINQIANSIFGLFFTDQEGRYAFRVLQETDEEAYDIKRWQIQSTPEFNFDNSEIISSVTIKYNKDWNEGTYTLYTDTSQQQAIINRFRIKKHEDFETLLTTAANATSHATERLDLSGNEKITFTFQVDFRAIEIKLGDIIKIEANKAATTFQGNRWGEVIGIVYPDRTGFIEVTCRELDITKTYIQGCYIGTGTALDNFIGDGSAGDVFVSGTQYLTA